MEDDSTFNLFSKQDNFSSWYDEIWNAIGYRNQQNAQIQPKSKVGNAECLIHLFININLSIWQNFQFV